MTGDNIEIMTQTETSTYAIDQIVIVDPSDVAVLASRSHPSVTLVTCYPFYFIGSAPHRFIVRAQRIPGPIAGMHPIRVVAHPIL